MAGLGGFGSANVHGGRERGPSQPQAEAQVLRMVQPDVLHAWGNPGGFQCEYLKDGSMRLSGPSGITTLPQGAPALTQMIAEGMSSNPQDVLLHNLGRSLGLQLQQQAPPPPQGSTVQTQTDPATGGQSLQHYTGPAFTAPPPGQVEIPMGPHQGPAAPGASSSTPAADATPGALTVPSSEAAGMSNASKLLLALAALALVATAAAAGAAAYSTYKRRRP
jgi:hypothetical protein